MDTNGKDARIKPISEEEGEKEKVGEREEENESESLLAPRSGGISKGLPKTRRKVQWNDKHGNQLAEVLEFQPSDASDSEDEDADSCLCTIM